jgi:hypothetical protein
METMMVEDNGKWWKFVIPASAGGCVEFVEEGYTGSFYAIQDYKDGEVTEQVDSKGWGGPAHAQRSGKTNAAYLVWQSGEVIKGKQVKKT